MEKHTYRVDVTFEVPGVGSREFRWPMESELTQDELCDGLSALLFKQDRYIKARWKCGTVTIVRSKEIICINAVPITAGGDEYNEPVEIVGIT